MGELATFGLEDRGTRLAEVDMMEGYEETGEGDMDTAAM